MPYTMQHLVEQSGLAARTIRHCVERGLIPRPRGLGPAAEYEEDHLVRAVAIARMRARAMSVDAIAEHVQGWTTACISCPNSASRNPFVYFTPSALRRRL